MRTKTRLVSDDAPKRRTYDYTAPPPTPKAANWLNANGRPVTLYTAMQLEQAGSLTLRRRAQKLQEALGAENLPDLPTHGAPMMRWILNAQVALSATTDRPRTVKDFGGGLPLSAEECGQLYFGAGDKWLKNPAAVRKPDWTQQELSRLPASEAAVSSYLQLKKKAATLKQSNSASRIFSL